MPAWLDLSGGKVDRGEVGARLAADLREVTPGVERRAREREREDRLIRIRVPVRRRARERVERGQVVADLPPDGAEITAGVDAGGGGPQGGDRSEGAPGPSAHRGG